ncbi:hypothetical protein FPV67DRAFT_412463 [Lyophyllum atratum]|nr:hypothetical protein FPV67DRAFT_412463 [Lyophyllum atratum]
MDDFDFRANLEEQAAPFVPESLEEIREHIQRLREQIMAVLPANQLDQSQIQELLENLPRLEEQDMTDLGHQDSPCPICLTPYLAIIAEEEMALAMDSPAHPVEELGVTRLSRPWQCGHVFCRRDISKWIQEAHDSCPMCRHLLVKPETGVPNPQPAANAIDPGSPLRDVERQIEFHINLLRGQIQDARSLVDHSVAHITELEGASRSEFSGMYS